MKYAIYGQTATKIGKDGSKLIYSVVPTGQFETDAEFSALETFATIINGMPGKDRLHIEMRVENVDDTIVISAVYVPNDENARIARVVFD